MYKNSYPTKRFKQTLDFLKRHVTKDEKILDLGVENPFSIIMIAEGFQVTNTSGEDLDENQMALQADYDVVTAFEIVEHFLNPYTILKSISAKKILISVPLRLWFSPAYKSKTDIWDRHFHEFEDWQLDWLLEKTGWQIKDKKKFTHPTRKIGFRPLLRLFANRYYLVYAERM